MSSRQEEEQEAGPSGVSCDEVLALLGLNMSDNEEETRSSVMSRAHGG